MATSILLKKLSAARDRVNSTRNAFAVLRTINQAANKDSNRELFQKLLPYWRVVAAIDTSLKSFVLSNIVAIADPSSSASLHRICEDIKKSRPSTISMGELNRRITEISAIYKQLKDYRHKFISHLDHSAQEYIERFNELKLAWDDIQTCLDTLTFNLEFLDAAVENRPIPSREEVERNIIGFSDIAIDAREHTAQLLHEICERFPLPSYLPSR